MYNRQLSTAFTVWRKNFDNKQAFNTTTCNFRASGMSPVLFYNMLRNDTNVQSIAMAGIY
jgi:hypothetical protein